MSQAKSTPEPWIGGKLRWTHFLYSERPLETGWSIEDKNGQIWSGSAVQDGVKRLLALREAKPKLVQCNLAGQFVGCKTCRHVEPHGSLSSVYYCGEDFCVTAQTRCRCVEVQPSNAGPTNPA